jgi:hypothetical protein
MKNMRLPDWQAEKLSICAFDAIPGPQALFALKGKMP